MTLKDNVLQAIRHKETLWTPNVLTDVDIAVQSTVSERYEGKETGTDEFGVQYTFVPETNTPIVTPGTYVLDDITNWRNKVKIPNVDDYDWERGAERDTAGWDRKNKFSVVVLYNGPFERLHALMGFEEALMALLTEPESVNGFFETFEQYRICLIQKIKQYYNPDAIMLFDDYGTNTSMMMSPDIWRMVIKPHIKTLIDAVHDCGMFYILHSCGYIKPIFGDFVEMGADVVHPMQYANRVRELKDQYQDKITFTGGFNALEILDNPESTEEEIRAEVRRGLRELAPGGSYIAWQVILSGKVKKLFLEEVMKDSIPKMTAAGVQIPAWESLMF